MERIKGIVEEMGDGPGKKKRAQNLMERRKTMRLNKTADDDCRIFI